MTEELNGGEVADPILMLGSGIRPEVFRALPQIESGNPC